MFQNFDLSHAKHNECVFINLQMSFNTSSGRPIARAFRRVDLPGVGEGGSHCRGVRNMQLYPNFERGNQSKNYFNLAGPRQTVAPERRGRRQRFQEGALRGARSGQLQVDSMEESEVFYFLLTFLQDLPKLATDRCHKWAET